MAKELSVLDDMKDELTTMLVKRGVDPQDAQKIGHEMKAHFHSHWGGQIVYFTKKDLSDRDTQLYEKFNGNNKEQLIREYGITEQTFYTIIKRARLAYVEKNQIPLFD